MKDGFFETFLLMIEIFDGQKIKSEDKKIKNHSLEFLTDNCEKIGFPTKKPPLSQTAT